MSTTLERLRGSLRGGDRRASAGSLSRDQPSPTQDPDVIPQMFPGVLRFAMGWALLFGAIYYLYLFLFKHRSEITGAPGGAGLLLASGHQTAPPGSSAAEQATERAAKHSAMTAARQHPVRLPSQAGTRNRNGLYEIANKPKTTTGGGGSGKKSRLSVSWRGKM